MVEPIASFVAPAVFAATHVYTVTCTKANEVASHIQVAVITFFVTRVDEAHEAIDRCAYYLKQKALTIITYCVVPATFLFSAKKVDELYTEATTTGFQSLLQRGIIAEVVTMNIDYPEKQEHVTLNGVRLKPHIEGNATPKNTILYVMPNGDLWERHLNKLQLLQRLTGATILCYNYRQVGKSAGPFTSQENAIDDTMAVARHLIDQGIYPFIHGFSLGGGVGIQVVARLEQEGITLHHCNERSFASLPLVVDNLFPAFIASIVNSIIRWAHWTLESDAALAQLRGRVLIMSHAKDPVIRAPSQLKEAAMKLLAHSPSSPKARIEYIDMNAWHDEVFGHVRPWFSKEEEQYRDFVKKYVFPT